MRDIEGGCHCGAIRYRTRIDPDNVCVCHCTDCQKLTGSPFRVTVFAPREAIALDGEPQVYERFGDSGRRRLQHFCGRCASHLFTSGEDPAQPWGIRWGSIEDREALRPTRQIWCRSAMPWLDEITGTPASAQG